MKYKTNHIDEASYFAIKRHKYKTIKYGELNSEWIFEHTKELETLRKQFWGGNAIVNIHKWLALRTILKTEQKRKLSVSQKNPLDLINGDTYWFITPENTISSAYYGQAPVHAKRMKEGNAFRTQDEALKIRNASSK